MAMRMIPESTPKYSASPPHTPPSFESVKERIRRFGPTRFPADVSVWRAPQNEQKLEYSTISLRQLGQVMAILLTRIQVHQGTIPHSNLLLITQAGKEKFRRRKRSTGFSLCGVEFSFAAET